MRSLFCLALRAESVNEEGHCGDQGVRSLTKASGANSLLPLLRALAISGFDSCVRRRRSGNSNAPMMIADVAAAHTNAIGTV